MTSAGDAGVRCVLTNGGKRFRQRGQSSKSLDNREPLKVKAGGC